MSQSCVHIYISYILFVITSAVDIIENVCDVWLMNLILTGIRNIYSYTHKFNEVREQKNRQIIIVSLNGECENWNCQ